MNTYLKIAVLCLCIVVVALATLDIKTYNAFHQLKPLVIRINEVGRAEAITYGSLEYQPQEAELKYFLAQFVQSFYGLQFNYDLVIYQHVGNIVAYFNTVIYDFD